MTTINDLYNACKKDFGEIVYKGKTYALLDYPDVDQRELKEPFNGYYMDGNCMDTDGNSYSVSWRIELEEGETDENYDYFDKDVEPDEFCKLYEPHYRIQELDESESHK